MTFISHETAQKLKNLEKNQTISIRLKTKNLFEADRISAEVIEETASIPYGNYDSLSYISWKSSHGTLFEAIKFEKLLISLMLFLIIAVASILVLSTVVMTVKSKKENRYFANYWSYTQTNNLNIFYTRLICKFFRYYYRINFRFYLYA